MGISHLYRLTVNADNTVKVEVDQTELYSGNMKDDWELLKPKIIADPEDKKPGDWVAEEDGEWEAPMKDNPEYKGDWKAKRISNPEYKGVWEAKKIDNPEFVDDDAVYKYADFGFIGFDLWQVKAETIFDNIIITDDAAEADKFAEKWKALNAVETAAKKEEDKKKAEEEAKKAEEKSDDDDDDDEEEEDDKE